MSQWSEIKPSFLNNLDSKCHIVQDVVKDIQCGLYHTIFLTANGNVWSLGQNWNGQLGLSESIRATNEAQLVHFMAFKNKQCITPFSSASNIFNGSVHGWCGSVHLDDVDEYSITATTAPGTVHATDHMDHDTIWKLDESVRIKAISCGDAHNLCIDEHGELWIFGHIAVHHDMKESIFEPMKHPYFEREFVEHGNDGNESLHSQPAKREIHCTKISCGSDHSVCCDSNGICYLFGSNEKGQSGSRAPGMLYEPYVFQSVQSAKTLDKGDGDGLHELSDAMKFKFETLKVVDVQCGRDHTVCA